MKYLSNLTLSALVIRAVYSRVIAFYTMKYRIAEIGSKRSFLLQNIISVGMQKLLIAPFQLKSSFVSWRKAHKNPWKIRANEKKFRENSGDSKYLLSFKSFRTVPKNHKHSFSILFSAGYTKTRKIVGHYESLCGFSIRTTQINMDFYDFWSWNLLKKRLWCLQRKIAWIWCMKNQSVLF